MKAKSLLVLVVTAHSVFWSYQLAWGAPPATAAQDGRHLFKRFQCSQCHSIESVGGCMGPPLDAVTKHRTDEYLRLRLTNTKEDEFIEFIKHPELFPHPRFKPAHVESLIAYFKSLKPITLPTAKAHRAQTVKESTPPAAFQPLPASPSSREGRRLFLQTGCISCHSIGNSGGSQGPALDGIGARHGRNYIKAQVTNPYAHLKAAGKTSRMVQCDLFPDQVKAITDYLLTLPPK